MNASTYLYFCFMNNWNFLRKNSKNYEQYNGDKLNLKFFSKKKLQKNNK